MVTLAIIGLAMSMMASGSRSLLPQTRLRAAAEELGSAVERARSWAVLRGERLELVYDLEKQTYEAALPYATDDEGRPSGPGRSPLIDPTPLPEGIEFSEVRLEGGLVRDDGLVTLEITALGRVPSHEVVFVNPEHRQTELYTTRINGLNNRSVALKGDVTMAPVTDVDFR
jgi:hypothetical protein